MARVLEQDELAAGELVREAAAVGQWDEAVGEGIESEFPEDAAQSAPECWIGNRCIVLVDIGVRDLAGVGVRGAQDPPCDPPPSKCRHYRARKRPPRGFEY